MPISSRVTLTAIQQERRKGLALQGMDLKFPVHIIPSTFFKLLKQRNKKKIQKSKGKETKVGMRSYTRQPSQPIRPLQQKKVILYSDTSQKSVSQKFRTQKTTKIILKLDPKYSFEKNLFDVQKQSFSFFIFFLNFFLIKVSNTSLLQFLFHLSLSLLLLIHLFFFFFN